MSERKWLIYDSRAIGGDTDSAIVLDTAETEDEARQVLLHYEGGAVAYSYELQGDELVDERGPYKLVYNE